MSAIAGRVLLIPKGAYNALTTYNPLDFVTYGADSYVCKQTSTGNAPTNTTYWQLMAKGATDADQVAYDNTASGMSATDVQAAVDELASEKQDETLSTPITIEGVSKATVESALSGLNDYADDISDVISKNGAKNLLPNTAVSKVDSGVTLTVNSDGTISTSGTSSGNFIFDIGTVTLKAGTYKVSGCPSGGGGSTYRIGVGNSDWSVFADDDGNGATLTLTADTTLYGRLTIYNSANVTGKVFKPMITLASQPDSDYAHYVPYAMTNRELTERVTAIAISVPSSVTNIKDMVMSAFNQISSYLTQQGQTISVGVEWEGVDYFPVFFTLLVSGYYKVFMHNSGRMYAFTINSGSITAAAEYQGTSF